MSALIFSLVSAVYGGGMAGGWHVHSGSGNNRFCLPMFNIPMENPPQVSGGNEDGARSLSVSPFEFSFVSLSLSLVFSRSLYPLYFLSLSLSSVASHLSLFGVAPRTQTPSCL
jgi:hypothetical protein